MSEVQADFSFPASLPDKLPVIALLRGVLLPGCFAPYNVGRARSVAAVEQAVDGLVLVVPQIEPVRDPAATDLLPVGTLARLVRDQRRNGGRMVVAQGLARVRITGVASSDPAFQATFEVIDGDWPATPEGAAMRAAFRDAVAAAAEEAGEADKLAALVEAHGQHARLIDAVAGAVEAEEDWLREVLTTSDPITRAEKVLGALAAARELSKARKAVEKRLRTQTRERNREAMLRQQLEAIKAELGEEEASEVARLRARLAERDLPEEAREAVDKELTRLERVPTQSPEHGQIVDWLTRVADLPWGTFSADDVDFDALERTLDDSHFGLDDVKRQVIEHLSVRQLAGTGRADVLLLVGPPGVGKTSIATAIAEATGRKLVRVALGGLRDEAELRGHRRTYIGARPGRLVEGFRRAGTMDPVVLLDEVDKLARGVLGDPAAALLEILDPEQNHAFVDHYLELPFDLSRALFIATANDLSGLPAPLRDRMEVIELSGYTPAEKRTIARRHLLVKAAEAAGLVATDVALDDEVLDAIIDGWTREAGVRQLQRTVGRLYRAAAVQKARGRLEAPLRITVDDLPTYLKAPRFRESALDRPAQPGIVSGLAWTPVGGDVLTVEASLLPGKGQLVLTGQLGDVMKESARAALTYVLSHAAALGVPADALTAHDVHIHVPAGAIPKDGPSAGVTMFTALASLLSDRLVRPDTAMTGEATLRGRVLPVGGIKEKVLAAHRRGLTRVLLPEGNRPDAAEIPADVAAELELHFVADMADVLGLALLAEAEEAPPAAHDDPAAATAT